MTREDAFHRQVREALARIPEAFRPYLENVEIQVEDWAPDDLLDEMGVSAASKPRAPVSRFQAIPPP